jgi:hypothetical protein
MVNNEEIWRGDIEGLAQLSQVIAGAEGMLAKLLILLCDQIAPSAGRSFSSLAKPELAAAAEPNMSSKASNALTPE